MPFFYYYNQIIIQTVISIFYFVPEIQMWKTSQFETKAGHDSPQMGN